MPERKVLNSQPPCHESDMLNTDHPGRAITVRKKARKKKKKKKTTKDHDGPILLT